MTPTAGDYLRMQATALALPLMAGLLLNGWRGLAVMAGVMLSAAAAALVWRNVGRRGGLLSIGECTVQACLLGLLLPAHLASESVAYLPGAPPLWPMIPTAGLILVFIVWCLGSAGRTSAPAAALLAVVVLHGQWLMPRSVLARQHMPAGDVLNSIAAPPGALEWYRAPAPGNADAIERRSSAEVIGEFVRGSPPAGAGSLSMEALIRDHLPPLDDVIVAGDPRPIGLGSAVMVIAAGLLMVRRRLTDHRVPLWATLAALVTFALAPTPLLVSESGAQWSWGIMHPSAAGAAVGLTFIAYQMLCGPLLMVLLVLAAQPGVRPMQPRARTAYGLLLGFFAALLQLHLDVATGPYAALLVCGLLTPALDRWLARRPG